MLLVMENLEIIMKTENGNLNKLIYICLKNSEKPNKPTRELAKRFTHHEKNYCIDASV
jgi:hypothetical protein